MTDIADAYRHRLIRAITGLSPFHYVVDDPKALDRICEHLAENEDALDTLRHKGYGDAFTTLAETIELVPDKPKKKR